MEISVTEANDFKVVKLGGKIGWAEAEDLDKRIKDIIDGEKYYNIVFNLDDVTFICSGGVGAIISNLKRVREHNGGLYFISSSQYINFILDTLCFDKIFEGCLYQTFDDFYQTVVHPRAS